MVKESCPATAKVDSASTPAEQAKIDLSLAGGTLEETQRLVSGYTVRGMLQVSTVNLPPVVNFLTCSKFPGHLVCRLERDPSFDFLTQ